MNRCLGLLIATSILFRFGKSVADPPSKTLFINRAEKFMKTVEFKSRGISPPEVVSTLLKKLNTFFTTMANSPRSNWFFNDFSHRLEHSRHNFDIGLLHKLKPQYFFYVLDGLGTPFGLSNFPIDVLAFSNVNVLEEIGGWMQDPVRQKLLGRLLGLASRIGICKRSLGNLYQELQQLQTEGLEQRIADLEAQVGTFMQASPPKTLVPAEIYAQFVSENSGGLYRYYHPGRAFSDVKIQEKVSILTEVVLSIHTEARIGIVPPLIVFIRSLLPGYRSTTADDSFELIIGETYSPKFIFLQTLLQVIVRIANSSRYSMVSLALFIDSYCDDVVKKQLITWEQPATSGAIAVYLLSHEVFKRFGIRVLDSYPALAQSIGWSAERARAIQRIIIHMTIFGLNYPDLNPSRSQLDIIVGASDEKLIRSADFFFRMLTAHLMLQMQNIFIEPLVDPVEWLEEYAKESGSPSPYALKVMEFQPPILTHAYLTTHTPILEEMSFGIMDYLGYPHRFVEMSKKLSFIDENYPAVVVRYLGVSHRGRDIFKLPRAIMKREIDWNMIDKQDGIRDNMEQTAFILIDTLKILVEQYRPAENVFRLTVSNFKNCMKALGSFLTGLHGLINLERIKRIRSESDQVWKSVLGKVDINVRLCDF